MLWNPTSFCDVRMRGFCKIFARYFLGGVIFPAKLAPKPEGKSQPLVSGYSRRGRLVAPAWYRARYSGQRRRFRIALAGLLFVATQARLSSRHHHTPGALCGLTAKEAALPVHAYGFTPPDGFWTIPLRVSLSLRQCSLTAFRYISDNDLATLASDVFSPLETLTEL